jgi:2-phosphosulfolactate phosphatase
MKINVIPSFRLLQPERVKDGVCVVIDIFRATSTICVALHAGCTEVKPVATIAACRDHRKDGYLLVGERDGDDIAEFDFNNSPRALKQQNLAGKKICLTTTNGTLAIDSVSHAHEVIIGSFLNISTVIEYLIAHRAETITCVCSGRNSGYDLCGGDILFAGALITRLKAFGYQPAQDNALIAEHFYEKFADNRQLFFEGSDFKRRAAHNDALLKDGEFCLQEDYCKVLPILTADKLLISTT